MFRRKSEKNTKPLPKGAAKGAEGFESEVSVFSGARAAFARDFETSDGRIRPEADLEAAEKFSGNPTGGSGGEKIFPDKPRDSEASGEDSGATGDSEVSGEVFGTSGVSGHRKVISGDRTDGNSVEKIPSEAWGNLEASGEVFGTSGVSGHRKVISGDRTDGIGASDASAGDIPAEQTAGKRPGRPRTRSVETEEARADSERKKRVKELKRALRILGAKQKIMAYGGDPDKVNWKEFAAEFID